ncbi:hypothetical protein DFJ74DRAFT_11154 [Hyaloraphidium curvatum]|nr:hypothetical protein DFJ74DRAFT_11154 [Hyaloraphidium curvatum]
MPSKTWLIVLLICSCTSAAWALPAPSGAKCLSSGAAGGCASFCCFEGTCRPYRECFGVSGAALGSECTISEGGNCASGCCYLGICSEHAVCFGWQASTSTVDAQDSNGSAPTNSGNSNSAPTHEGLTYFNPEFPDGTACSVDRHDDCASHCCFEGACSNPTLCGSPIAQPVGAPLYTSCSAHGECATGCCSAGVCSWYGQCFGDSVDTASIPSEFLDPTYQPLSIRLVSPTQWCLMFPIGWQIIGDHEFEAHVLCSGPMVADSGGKLPAAPEGIVRKAWVGKGSDGQGTEWIQMSGMVDRSFFAEGDTGGQYDSDGEPVPSDPNRGAPRGSNCAGYDEYVELLNPATELFCVRCCKGPASKTICNFRFR